VSYNHQVSGKIVVYNSAWQGSYGPTVQYRREGAIRAAEKGAVAALIRSVTDFSIASPHTGTQVRLRYSGKFAVNRPLRRSLSTSRLYV
jgi:hypothetical protein